MPEGPGLPSGVIQLRNLVVGRLKRPSFIRAASKLSSRHTPSTSSPIMLSRLRLM